MAKITGTAGADNDLTGTASADFIYGYDGADRLDGGAGDDRLYGGAGNDTLLGGEGDDQLSGGEGADSMVGGVGNDTYFVDDRGDRVVEFGGEGIDTVVFGGYTSEITFGEGGEPLYTNQNYKLSSNVEVLRLLSNGLFTTGENAENDLNLGGSGNDLGNRILGNAGNNSLRGLGGNDDINGGAGNDIISGDQGNDTLNGGNGTDEVTYKAASGGVKVSLATTAAQDIGADQGIDRLTGFENLEGSQFADRLTGDAGANKISGLGGNDTIIGGAGNDDLTGGTGNDIFVLSAPGTGVDTIRGYQAGDQIGYNLADFSGSTLLSYDTAQGTGPQGIYDTKSHILYFDQDGTGTAFDRVALAQFDHDVKDQLSFTTTY